MPQVCFIKDLSFGTFTQSGYPPLCSWLHCAGRAPVCVRRRRAHPPTPGEPDSHLSPHRPGGRGAWGGLQAPPSLPWARPGARSGPAPDVLERSLCFLRQTNRERRRRRCFAERDAAPAAGPGARSGAARRTGRRSTGPRGRQGRPEPLCGPTGRPPLRVHHRLRRTPGTRVA